MTKRGFIEIAHAKRASAFTARLKLPLNLGRKPAGPNRIVLDPANKTISNSHGFIDDNGDGLYYRDTSTNGTLVNGRLVHNASAWLDGRFEIEIREFRITPVEARPLLIAAISSRNDIHEAVELLPGTYASLLPRRSPHRLTVTYDEPEPEAIVNFIHRTDAIYLSRARNVQVRVNRHEVADGRIEVRPGDVTFIDGERLEVLTHDTHRIVCGHAPCRLLNPPQIHALCKWCGHDLANVNSVSRIFVPV